MRTTLGLLAALALLMGAAACSSSDDDNGDATTTVAADNGDDNGGDDGDGGSEGGSDTIAAYCDAVQDYISLAEDVQADPTDMDLLDEFAAAGEDLATQAADLAADAVNFTPADLEEFEACQTDFASAG